MPDRPILIFPSATVQARQKLPSGFDPASRLPSRAQQRRRLTARFDALSEAFGAIKADAGGLDPELVIVFEVAGTIAAFQSVVKQIGGMEWLGDFDVDIAEPDPAFFEEGTPVEPIGGRLFILVANHSKANEVIQLWQAWCRSRDGKLPRNYGKLAKVFEHLNDVRLWGVKDRVRDTVIEWWKESIGAKKSVVRFEIDLWCRQLEEARRGAFARLQSVVQAAGGQCVIEAAIPDIDYHGVLVDLPASEVRGTLRAIHNNTDTRLLRLTDVKYFCALGQAILPQLGESRPDSFESRPLPTGNPIVALLDGLPLQNHALLRDRLLIDDPDDFARLYNVGEHRHGTAMASLIVRGELDRNEPAMPRPVYVRPIMYPGTPDLNNERWEQIPANYLPVDLTFRAIKRMVDSDGGMSAVAPTVKVVNFSIGDARQLFDRELSPWARLLDWLAWRYNLLFIVSAGNHTADVKIEAMPRQLPSLPDQDLRSQVIRALAKSRFSRRLLAPAESINALTVGALHTDGGPQSPYSRVLDPLRGARLCSPISSISSGFRRSIKPDILVAGGRQHYTLNPASSATVPAVLGVSKTSTLGQRVAAPGGRSIPPSHSLRMCGTSNAAALASRQAALFYERIVEMRSEPGGDTLTENFVVVLLKALLVHGASWNDNRSTLAAALQLPDNRDPKTLRACAQFLGYGESDWVRASTCTDERVVLLGCGKLEAGQAHLYNVPLPPALNAVSIRRRLTLTLAWVTPVNPRHRSYRVADLWFDLPEDSLRVSRRDADAKGATRGTVQHEVFEGDSAVPITEGDTAAIRVNCRPEAAVRFDTPIPYAIAVTLEVGEPLGVSIYEQVKVALERIRSAARVRTVATSPPR